jgi:hypothetical protein
MNPGPLANPELAVMELRRDRGNLKARQIHQR